METHGREILPVLWGIFYPLLLYQMIVALVLSGWTVIHGELGSVPVLLLTGCAAGIALVPLSVIYWREKAADKKRQENGPGSYAKTDLATALWVVLAGAASCLVINHVLQFLPAVSEGYKEAERAIYSPSAAVQIFCTGLIIPLTEELIFRGLAFKRLRKVLSFPVATVTSAVYFGLFHGNLLQGIYAVLLGLLLGVLYECKKKLLYVWLLHAAANLTALAFTFLELSPEAGISTMGLTAAGVLLMVVSFYRIIHTGCDRREKRL